MKRPGVERTEAKHLDADAVTAVLRAAQNSRYYPALLLVASTGLRMCECLALKWSDVDLDAGALVVRATLGRIGDRLVISEPKHRITQKAERLRAANKWQNTELVFTSELGGPVDPRNFLRVIETAANTAGVQGVGIHTLRHSAAVAWLESGVHIKAVADLLGHNHQRHRRRLRSQL